MRNGVTAPLHILFIMIKIKIFTNEHNFYAFWNLNTTARSKKLSVGYKQTTPQLHGFDITDIWQFVYKSTTINITL